MKKKLFVLAGLLLMMSLMAGCGADLTPEETGIIRITITPRPVYTPTPVPGGDGNSLGSNVTMTNDYNGQEDGEQPEGAADAEMQYDMYGNAFTVDANGNIQYYDAYGNPFTYDSYGNIVYQ